MSAAHHPRWLVILRIVWGLFSLQRPLTYARFPITGTTSFMAVQSGGEYDSLFTHPYHLGQSLRRFLSDGRSDDAACGLDTITDPYRGDHIVQKGGFSASEMWLAILTLLLLIFFLFEGGGPVSLDAYFQNNRTRGSQGRNLP